MLTLKNFTISFLILFATALSGWSIIISHFSHAPALTNDPSKADTFMEEVIATTINKEGNPTLKLITPKMVHYPKDDSTDIMAPRVTIYRKSPEPWHIDSNFAKTTNGTSTILFWSHVNIHHSTDAENPETNLLTESLTVFPDKKLASTDLPITFIQPDTTVHAVGMLANLNDNTIKLLSATQGEYAPAS
jgi:lipopolysaccharide export system protein LptC